MASMGSRTAGSRWAVHRFSIRSSTARMSTRRCLSRPARNSMTRPKNSPDAKVFVASGEELDDEAEELAGPGGGCLLRHPVGNAHVVFWCGPDFDGAGQVFPPLVAAIQFGRPAF